MARISEQDAINMGLIKKKHKYNCSSKEDRAWTGYFRGRKQTIVFDSKKEMFRFLELNRISTDLCEMSLQERFLVGTDPITYYVADFYYYDKIRQCWVAEDVKGRITQVYKRKRKLFKEKYPNILFLEIL